MPKYTSNYGAKGSQVNELGQRLTPKPIWNSTDGVNMARSAFGFMSRLDIESMVREFFNRTGERPTELRITDKSTTAKAECKTYRDIGFVSLSIIPNATHDHLQ